MLDRSFKQLLTTAEAVAMWKHMMRFRGKVNLKVTANEYCLVIAQTMQRHPNVRLCDIPLRVTHA